MPIIQFPETPPARIFFCDSFERCAAPAGLTPFQIIGNVPCLPEDVADCRPDPCQTLCVFGSNNDNDRENDTSHFLFDFPSQSGNEYIIEQWTGSSWVAVGFFDNATGTKFDFGTWVEYPFRSGVSIEWKEVLALFGEGFFRLKIEGLFPLVDPPSLVSLPYQLKQFSCKAAEKTVRIKTSFTGFCDNLLKKEGSEIPDRFDLNSMRWNDEIRLKGNLFDLPSERESSVFVRNNNRRTHHRKRIQKNYNLVVNQAIQTILDRIDLYSGACDFVTVNNYFSRNSYHYTERDLIFEGSTFTYTWNNSQRIQVATQTMKDRFSKEFGRC